MWRIASWRLASFAVLVLLAAPAAGATITAGGTGTAAPLLRALAAEYARVAPGFELRLIDPPLGSGGALKALAGGRIDFALIGRAPKGDEAAAVGESFELARTPFVLASSDGVRPTGFTLQDLAEVYSGRTARWDDGRPLRLILRSAFESDTAMLRSMSPDMPRAVDASFARKGMAVAENDLDTVELIGRIPGSLAPTTLGLLSLLGRDLRVFPIEGQAPSAAALADGSYRWMKPLVAAVGKAPTPAVRDFVAFLRSPQARALLLRHQFVAVPQ